MGNKTKVVVKILVMMLISVVICVMNMDSCYRWLSMQVCSPQSYYHDVVSRQMRRWTMEAEKIYDPLWEKLVSTGEPKRITCKVELGDTLKALSSNLRLDSIALIADGERDGEEVLGQIALQINDQDALHVAGYLNYGEQYGHVQIPELSEARLTLTQLVKQELEGGYIGDKYLFPMMGDARKYLPQVEKVSALLAKYPYLVLGQENDVTRSQKQVQAGGISKKCTQYTATYTGETCYQICQDLLNHLQQDADTIAKEMQKDLQEHAPEMTWEMEQDMKRNGETQTPLEKQLSVVDTGYQAALGFLQEKQEELEEHKELFLAEQSEVVLKILVDSAGNIAGCSVNMNIEGKMFDLSYLLLRKGTDIGCEWNINVDDIVYLDISGSGTIRGGKLSGDFNISLDESLNPDPDQIQSMDSILQLSIQDLDLLALMQKQEIRGAVEISTGQIPALQYYQMRISLDHSDGQNNDMIQIMTGKNVFATIHLWQEEGEQPDVGKRKDYDGTKNSYRLTDLGELANYASEIDLDQVLKKIEQDCGANLEFLQEIL